MNNTSAAGRQQSLRPYQIEIIEHVEALIGSGLRRLLIPLPTGGGKTVLAAEIARRAVLRRSRVLFLVHRRELVAQSGQKLHATGLDFGIVAADWPSRPGEPIQVASVQTLHARAIRSAAIGLPPADVVIVDEAHHAIAGSWRRLIEAYPDAAIIGLSATPCRGDGRGLGDMFQELVPCPGVPELIAGGFLVPTLVYAPPDATPNLEGVQVKRGDYVEKQLAERVDTPKLVGDIVSTWHRLNSERRKTAVFATSIAHAVHLRDEFARSGVVAEHLDGSTPTVERDGILSRLAAGSVDVVVNCGVLTEGWDSPSVSCIVLARPTRSLGLYRQIVGRGLRPALGKTDCLVLDHAGATLAHGFVDEPIEWSLAADRKAERASAGGSNAHAARILKTCPECSAVRWSGKPCPACGWRPKPKPVPVDFQDGELGQVDRNRAVRRDDPTEAERRRWHSMLAWLANAKGYAPGWVAHKYREKFGSWPQSRNPTPIVPSDECRAWVRSRQIAWARSQPRAGVR